MDLLERFLRRFAPVLAVAALGALACAAPASAVKPASGPFLGYGAFQTPCPQYKWSVDPSCPDSLDGNAHMNAERFSWFGGRRTFYRLVINENRVAAQGWADYDRAIGLAQAQNQIPFAILTSSKPGDIWGSSYDYPDDSQARRDSWKSFAASAAGHLRGLGVTNLEIWNEANAGVVYTNTRPDGSSTPYTAADYASIVYCPAANAIRAAGINSTLHVGGVADLGATAQEQWLIDVRKGIGQYCGNRAPGGVSFHIWPQDSVAYSSTSGDPNLTVDQWNARLAANRFADRVASFRRVMDTSYSGAVPTKNASLTVTEVGYRPDSYTGHPSNEEMQRWAYAYIADSCSANRSALKLGGCFFFHLQDANINDNMAHGGMIRLDGTKRPAYFEFYNRLG